MSPVGGWEQERGGSREGLGAVHHSSIDSAASTEPSSGGQPRARCHSRCHLHCWALATAPWGASPEEGAGAGPWHRLGQQSRQGVGPAAGGGGAQVVQEAMGSAGAPPVPPHRAQLALATVAHNILPPAGQQAPQPQASAHAGMKHTAPQPRSASRSLAHSQPRTSSAASTDRGAGRGAWTQKPMP